MVIRYLPFCSCLQSEIDALYQNIYFQTFIEQNQEWNTKGAVHEIPGIFFGVGTVFAFITAADNPRIFQEFDFFLNR